MTPEEEKSLKRWRLVLGETTDSPSQIKLSVEEKALDKTLGTLYDQNKKGDLSGSAPNVNKWLGDIRTYFPDPVTVMMQKDAVRKLGIEKFLEAPDVLEQIVPDVQLAYTILSLKDAIPDQVKATARQVIEKMAQSLEKQLKMPVTLAANKGIQRYQRRLHKQNKLLDWPRTIRYNLKHYDAVSGKIIPEKIFGYNARKRRLREVFILLDQSGSMSSSLVYTGIIASILFKLPALDTHLVLFDSQVIDMTALLNDPVELLFGVQLGGGTDIIKALSFARQKMRNPRECIVFVVSDLYDNAPDHILIEKFHTMHQDGIRQVVIPAISDSGRADFNKNVADRLSSIGIETVACSPDKFCEILPRVLAGG